MANFTAKDVNELRKSTGVGMMDCKKALTEADGDVEKAMVILREKGLATQAKKAGRAAAEGIVMSKVNADNTVGVVVEVNSETDFVAKNDEFKAFVSTAADVEALLATTATGSDKTIKEIYDDLFLKIRENMQIRRFVRLEGILVPYVHGDGQIGVMVKLESNLPASAELLECGKNVALQVAALNAPYLNKEAVLADVIENEKTIILAQMAEDPKMASKPEQVKVKIAEGKVGKYYSENCLLEQEYVKDGEFTVKKYVDSVAKKLGGEIKVVDYIRYERGEGVQKKEDNFADEVASMANMNKQ